MRTLGFRLGSLLLTVLTGALACGDEGNGSGGVYESIPEQNAERTFATELCRLQLERCECPRADEIFGSFAECVDAYAAQLEMQFAEAKAAGLEYHPDCMAEQVNFYTQTLACTTQSQLTNEVFSQLNTPPCKVHTGSGQEGDTCMPYYQALGDDCDVGLQCLGTCMVVAELTAKVEGEACDLQTDRCEPGTACLGSPDDPTGPASCLRLPGDGQPCTVGCDVGLTCEPINGGNERVCLTPPGAGQPCGSFPYECAAGFYCDAAVCAATLAEGQPCPHDEACGIGFECDAIVDGGDDVCKPEDAFVCI